MFSYIAGCLEGAMNLAKGLGITFKEMLVPPVTIQYPFEKKPVAERYRGVMGLTAKAKLDITKQQEGDDNDLLKCISCYKCMDACPVECIDIQRERGGKGKFILKGFSINFARCTFCGLCVDACPVKGKAIVHTRHYEEVFFERKDMVFDVNMLSLVGQGVRPIERLDRYQAEVLDTVASNLEAFGLNQEEAQILQTAMESREVRRLNPKAAGVMEKIITKSEEALSDESNSQAKLLTRKQVDLLKKVLSEDQFELSTFGAG